jgi:multiple sugar transport system substrate-binding protein
MFSRLFLCLLMVGLVVTACVSPSVENGESANGVTLTLLISGDPTDEAAYQQLIDAFVTEHSDIAVNLINIPSSGDFRKRLAADFAAGTPPDLFLINYRNLGRFAASGAVEPLTDYLANSQ